MTPKVKTQDISAFLCYNIVLCFIGNTNVSFK